METGAQSPSILLREVEGEISHLQLIVPTPKLITSYSPLNQPKHRQPKLVFGSINYPLFTSENSKGQSSAVVNPKPSVDLSSRISHGYKLKPTSFHQGKPSVVFHKSDKNRLINNLRYVLVGKFSHGRPPLFSIKAFVAKLKLKGPVSISIFDSKHIFLECDFFEDFVKLWMQIVWIIDGYIMRMFKWSEDFHPSKESHTSPVWIHLPGLPLYLFDELALLSLANVVGKPLKVDIANINRSRLGCASICVELDVSSDVVDMIWIEFIEDNVAGMGEGFWQKVAYSTIPSFCAGCAHLGHTIANCKRSIQGSMVLVKDNEGKTTGLQSQEGILSIETRENKQTATSCTAANNSEEALQKVTKNIFATLEEEVLVEDLTLEEGELAENNVTAESQETAAESVRESAVSLDVITGVPRSDATLREVPAVLRSVAGESVEGMLELKLVSAGLQEVAAGEGYDNEVLVEDLTLEEGEFVEGATAMESSSPVMDDAAAGEFSTEGNDPPRVLELTKVNAGSEELASGQLTAGVLNATEMETEEAQVQEASSEGGRAGEYATEELALMLDFPGVLADKGSDGCRELTAGVSDASSEHSAGVSAERLNAATRTSATAADGSALHIGAESVLQAAAAGLAEAASDLARQPATPGTPPETLETLVDEPAVGESATQVLFPDHQLGYVLDTNCSSFAGAAAGQQDNHTDAAGGDSAAPEPSALKLLRKQTGLDPDAGLIQDCTHSWAVLVEEGKQDNRTASPPPKIGATSSSAGVTRKGCWADLVEEEQEQQLAREHKAILDWDAKQVKAFIHKQIEEIKQEIGQTETIIRDADKEEKNEQQIRIVSQLSLSEVEDFAKKEIEKIWATPTKVTRVFDTSSPIISNPYIRDKEGSPVLCSEIFGKSERLGHLRNVALSLKTEDNLAVLVERGTYDGLMKDLVGVYSKGIHQTIEEHQQTIFSTRNRTK